VDWKTLLAYITGSVDEQLLLRIEYLAAENGILRNQIKGRLHLSDAERTTLAELGKQLGKRALEEVAKVATPDTILGWHRKLVVQKFDAPPSASPWVVPVDKNGVGGAHGASSNRSWGYDVRRCLGASGVRISDQTVGNILKRRGLPLRPSVRRRPLESVYPHAHGGVVG
jgi:hypothetical protein